MKNENECVHHTSSFLARRPKEEKISSKCLWLEGRLEAENKRLFFFLVQQEERRRRKKGYNASMDNSCCRPWNVFFPTLLCVVCVCVLPPSISLSLCHRRVECICVCVFIITEHSKSSKSQLAPPSLYFFSRDMYFGV